MVPSPDSSPSEDGNTTPKAYFDFEPVVKLSGEDWWISYDKTYGLYCEYHGSGWDDDELELKVVEWPSQFRRRGIHDGRESPYLLYERDGSNAVFEGTADRTYQSHLVRSGQTICRVNANVPDPKIVEGKKQFGFFPKEVPHPAIDQMTPIEDITPAQWDSISLCTYCSKVSENSEILPFHRSEDC